MENGRRKNPPAKMLPAKRMNFMWYPVSESNMRWLGGSKIKMVTLFFKMIKATMKAF